MYGDREYVVFEEQRYTFRVAHERALRTAAMFKDVYGVGKGGFEKIRRALKGFRGRRGRVEEVEMIEM